MQKNIERASEQSYYTMSDNNTILILQEKKKKQEKDIKDSQSQQSKIYLSEKQLKEET